ncbi:MULTISPECIES: phosphoribosyltransferase family protein [Acinetobacter]|uniref:phosphoribosyltransferase family protein n=1 Tax=Acinetobacter TaxID=469 RepID=UPI0002CF7916|nr:MULTISPECIES: phosphoribosyltransferase family protein [Acinetobacter]ENX61228.1 hypothetical protein F885_01628 [Acinetobacter higginsii]MCH7318870.1 ribose-phosphate pyrophosphokinase [Acinetobacter higginsii]
MTIQLMTAQANVPIEFLQFSGGERHIQLQPELLNQLQADTQIKASLQNSTDVMDYLLLENVLLEQGTRLSVEIPYFPYARQDRICAQGQAFSLDLMTKLLNSNSEKFVGQRQKIVVWDCHSPVTLELLRKNTSFQTVINIEPIEIIQKSPALMQILSADNTVLICPDAGATQRTQAIANGINPQRQQTIEVIHCEKKRDPSTGKIRTTAVDSPDLTGKTAVITDDICDGGATFIGIAKQLRSLNCQNIILYVTHGIFSKGLAVFDGLVDQLFTSNSLPQAEASKLNIINFQNQD